MTRKCLFALISLLWISGSAFAAAPQAIDFSELNHEAGMLANQGQWDRSEVVFLKAAQSPHPHDRAEAYEGLSNLYKRLKLFKKADRIEQKLSEEKGFIEKLVPKEDRYYKSYEPEWGDTYAKIAAREGISLKWLQAANDHKALIEGKEIRVPINKYRLIVSKKNKTMEWRRGKEVIKTYPVSVGRKGLETPEGSFSITSKVKNPTWYWLKKEIPSGSPKNLLGTRWLGIDHKGHGIHGTRDPKSIGVAASHGCVRMFNKDVEEMFEWIPLGTRVTIE